MCLNLGSCLGNSCFKLFDSRNSPSHDKCSIRKTGNRICKSISDSHDLDKRPSSLSRPSKMLSVEAPQFCKVLCISLVKSIAVCRAEREIGCRVPGLH